MKDILKQFDEDWDKYMTCGKCEIAFASHCPCQLNKRYFKQLMTKAIKQAKLEVIESVPELETYWKCARCSYLQGNYKREDLLGKHTRKCPIRKVEEWEKEQKELID